MRVAACDRFSGGLEPVALAQSPDGALWVVNHLSDSISIVEIEPMPARVVRTLLVGDEPRDIVFAGPGRGRAFVTTAHRGQISPVDPTLTTSGVGRADVWVFDAAVLGTAPGGEPTAILTLFGDTPRALAVTGDGSRVNAGIFRSGSRTTVLPPAGFAKASPTRSADGVAQPNTGLIVRFSGSNWVDERGQTYDGSAFLVAGSGCIRDRCDQ